MSWTPKIAPEAEKSFGKFDNSLKVQIVAGIKKVSRNPLPRPDGYGKPLGNKGGGNLTGFFKIKYKGIGIRVVYTLVLDKQIMNILVISPRDDDDCYKLAGEIYKKYGTAVFDDNFNLL
jgi:mRNA interferase RelE/StbE